MTPRVMGIVNVTPDSFSDGGRLGSVEAAVAHGLQLVADGAAILDIGGESTRPGATPAPVDEEIARTVPVIAALRARWDGAISIDTMKPEVARAAVAAGATMWNDVSGLAFAPDSVAVAELGGMAEMVGKSTSRVSRRTTQEAVEPAEEARDRCRPVGLAAAVMARCVGALRRCQQLERMGSGAVAEEQGGPYSVE